MDELLNGSKSLKTMSWTRSRVFATSIRADADGVSGATCNSLLTSMPCRRFGCLIIELGDPSGQVTHPPSSTKDRSTAPPQLKQLHVVIAQFLRDFTMHSVSTPVCTKKTCSVQSRCCAIKKIVEGIRVEGIRITRRGNTHHIQNIRVEDSTHDRKMVSGSATRFLTTHNPPSDLH